MRAQVPANTGKTIERLWRHSDAYKYKYKDNCADRIKSLFGLDPGDTLYFKEKFYLCIFRKEYIRYILKKIAFLLLDPSLNSGKIVITQGTTCMSAYVLRGRDSVVRILAVQKPGGYSVDPSTLSLYT